MLNYSGRGNKTHVKTSDDLNFLNGSKNSSFFTALLVQAIMLSFYLADRTSLLYLIRFLSFLLNELTCIV